MPDGVLLYVIEKQPPRPLRAGWPTNYPAISICNRLRATMLYSGFSSIPTYRFPCCKAATPVVPPNRPAKGRL